MSHVLFADPSGACGIQRVNLHESDRSTNLEVRPSEGDGRRLDMALIEDRVTVQVSTGGPSVDGACSIDTSLAVVLHPVVDPNWVQWLTERLASTASRW